MESQTMYRTDDKSEQFILINNLIFEAYRHIANREFSLASKIYEHIISAYREMPASKKKSVYTRAVRLRKLLDSRTPGRTTIAHSHAPMRMADGTRVNNLLHMVSVLDEISDRDFQFHVNYNRNDFAEWLEKKEKYRELAGIIREVQDRHKMKSVILKYLALENHLYRDA